MQTEISTKKIRIVYTIGLIVVGLLAIFALRWQVLEASRFQTHARARTQSEIIPGLRGTIYSADGSTLAYSEPAYNVYIYLPDLLYAERKELQTRDEFAKKVSPILDLGEEKIKQIVDEKRENGLSWFKITEGITIEKGRKLESLNRNSDGGKLMGFSLVRSAERKYPENELASQVLGLTSVQDDGENLETIGRGGLEGEWNGVLEPREGFIRGERDAAGNVIGLATQRTIEAKRGSSIYTSIDKNLQQMVEDKLEWGVEEFKADSGSIIVMDPNTGRIMAMANYPTYNPNEREANAEVYGNPAIAEPYELGSVGKTYTLSAALDTGAVKPDDVILPEGHEGCIFIHKDIGEVCTYDKRPQGPMPIKTAFRKSDNIYFLTLAQMLEEETFYNYLDKFGMGKQTGIDITGESFGYLKDWQYWNIADVSAYSYGHSYQQTLLQATTAVGALANYGVRMQPQVVSKIVEADGEEKRYEPIALERVISESTARTMDELMHNVYKGSIRDWEWEYRDLLNYKVSLKSGTALIPYKDKRGYSSDFNATYVGYDASPDRRFVMGVRLKAPEVGDLSSYNTRLLWLETFKEFKDYLGVPRKSEF